MSLTAPFPWFGGKSRVASIVWQRFGNVRNYVEPFFGSGAVLLGRPQPFDGVETINDKDGFVANFWRAVQAAPETVARFADWPVNENDLHARHVWLVERKEKLQVRLEGDPDFYDARIAGYWVWGIACWIGSGFCSGNGPWKSVEVDGARELVHVGDAGRGVSRQLPHLGDAGRGVSRKLPHLGTAGQDVALVKYLSELSSRLRQVRVACGNWLRVLGESSTFGHGLTAVFLDPPYSDGAARCGDLYVADDLLIAHDVRNWCIENGDNPLVRIALCGYEEEHKLPDTWECVPWKAKGGYAARNSHNKNAHRERIWFSPHCLKPDDAQPMLWEDEA